MRSEGNAPPRRRAGTAGGEGEARQRLVPGLTVLYHPDLERVGEWVALPELSRGGTAELSRLVPDFTPPFPERPGGTRRWPLVDAWLSRRPFLLSAAGGGAVRLELADSRTRVEADGVAVEHARVFAAEDLEAGVVLLLSGRVVLLLHRLDPRGAEPRPEGWPGAGSDADRALDLVGEGRAMAHLRRELAAAAAGGGPVLLRGEDGTGRERAARALHRLGTLPAGPFLRFDCANGDGEGGGGGQGNGGAAAGGGVDGTSAADVERLRSWVRGARGGTLFLDPVERLPLLVQGWLAAALGEGPEGARSGAAGSPLRSCRCGSPATAGMTAGMEGVRLVAASGTSLEGAVAEGRLRPRLLHLLMVRSVRLPPLRACREDLGRLLVHLLEWEQDRGVAHPGPTAWLPAPLVARLARHPWPGNQEQLRRVVARLARVRREEEAATRPAGPPSGSSASPACHPRTALAARLEAVLDAELGEDRDLRGGPLARFGGR